jgi:hypothetical protein
MSFMDKLRRYERIILIILVVFTASIFTVSFECAQLFSKPKEADLAGTFFYGEEEVHIGRATFEDVVYRWKSIMFLGSFLAMGAMDALSGNRIWDFYRSMEFKWGQPIPLWRWYEQQDIPYTPGVEMEKTPQDERIRKTIWNILVLLDVCRRMGITASDEEVREHIAQEFQQVMGYDEQRKPRPFNPEIYRAFLKSVMDLEPEAYERTVAEHLMLSKLRHVIQEGVVANDEEVFSEFVDANRQVLVHAVCFDPKQYAKSAYFISNVLLSEHFHSGYGKRLQSEMVSFEYVFASVDDVKDKLGEPAPEDLNNFYEGFKEELYKIEEQSNPAGNAQASSEGWAAEQKPAPSEAPEFKPFEEVKEDVRKRWLDRKAKEECLGAIHRFERDMEVAVLESEIKAGTEQAQSIAFDPIATKAGLRCGKTRFIPAHAMHELNNLFGEPTVAWPDAGRIDSYTTTNRILTANGYVMLRLSERQPPTDESFVPEVRKRVEEDYKKFTEKSAARKAAADFHTVLTNAVNSRLEKEGVKDILADKLTEEQKTKIREIQLAVFDEVTLERATEVLKCGFAKKTDPVEELRGRASDILKLAFIATPGTFLVDSEEAPFFVWQLRAKRPPPPSDFESQRKNLGDFVFRKTAVLYIRAWEEALVKEAKVTDYLEIARAKAANK